MSDVTPGVGAGTEAGDDPAAAADQDVATQDAAAQDAAAQDAGAQPAAATQDAADEPAGSEDRANRRKVREGLVISVKMDSTAVVGVVDRVRHARYAKTVQRTKRLYAHNTDEQLKPGDRVRLQETRPLSKLKRWRVVEVLERAK